MRVEATAKRVRVSPQKARLIVDQIRGLPVTNALDILNFDVQKSARFVHKLLTSAIANAENNASGTVDDLKVSEAYVNQSLTLKRARPHGRGRIGHNYRRTCHITLAVSDDE